MEPFQLKEKSALFLTDWQKEIPGLIAGFTTKNGGKSKAPFTSFNLGFHVSDDKEHVLQNREILGRLTGMPIDNWVSGEQVHHINIEVVSVKDKGKGAYSRENSLKNTDGLLSNEISVLATAFYADCVPLFFVDPVTNWFGIAHAGWKGTIGNIGTEMVRLLCQQGSDLRDIKVAIGPSISGDYYEVDEHVINQIPDKWHAEAVRPQVDKKYLLDLKQLNKSILLDAGLKEENIEVSSYCTYRDEDLFFSHRRDNGVTGRMLGFIGFNL